MKTSLTGGYTIKQAVKSQSSFKFLVRLVDSVVKTSLLMVNCPNLWSLSMIANNTISALCSRRPNEPGLLPNLGTHRDCIGQLTQFRVVYLSLGDSWIRHTFPTWCPKRSPRVCSWSNIFVTVQHILLRNSHFQGSCTKPPAGGRPSLVWQPAHQGTSAVSSAFHATSVAQYWLLDRHEFSSWSSHQDLAGESRFGNE